MKFKNVRTVIKMRTMIKRTAFLLLLTVSVIDAKSWLASCQTYLLGNRDASAEWAGLYAQACSDFDISEGHAKWLEPRFLSDFFKLLGSGYNEGTNIIWIDQDCSYSRQNKLYLVYSLAAGRKINTSFKGLVKIGGVVGLVGLIMGTTACKVRYAQGSKWWLYQGAYMGECILAYLGLVNWLKTNHKAADVLAAKALCNRNEHAVIQGRVNGLKEMIRYGEEGLFLRPSLQEQVDYFESALQG